MRWPTLDCGIIHDQTLSVSWDRARLGAEVDRRSARLRDLGVQGGDIIAILCSAGAPFVADLLAVWASGAVAAVLDRSLAGPEMESLTGFLRPSLVLVDPDDPELMPGVAHHCLDAGGTAGCEPPPANVTDTALILVTSGTTGSPKAVAFSHQALRNRIRQNVREIGAAALARTLVTLPASFGHGLIGNVLTPLFAGGDIVFPRRGATLPAELGRLIDSYRITFLTSVPALWRMALKFGAAPTQATLHRIHVGSAPLSEQLWRDIAAWSGAETVNCYGLTEAANWFSGASSRVNAPRSGLVGHPWGGAAAVRTTTGEIALRGEGELLIQSPSMMDGYLRRPDLTQGCMIEGWYRTGDRAEIEEDGQIVLHGRLKDEINRAGAKIQPAELDMLIETHPSVAEACTFASPDPITGEKIAVAVRLKPGMTATAEALTQWCRARIRHVAVPEKWYFVADLPRTPRGKTRRDEVCRMFAGEGK